MFITFYFILFFTLNLLCFVNLPPLHTGLGMPTTPTTPERRKWDKLEPRSGGNEGSGGGGVRKWNSMFDITGRASPIKQHGQTRLLPPSPPPRRSKTPSMSSPTSPRVVFRDRRHASPSPFQYGNTYKLSTIETAG